MRRALIVAVSLFALGVPACSGTNAVPASVPPDTPSFIDACINATPPPAPTSTPGVVPQLRAFVKTPIRGLIDLGQINFEIMPPAPYNTLYYACLSQTEISGIVVNDTWADLQPDYAGQPLNTATIDAALQLVERYNRFPGRSLGVRLRVWAGLYAPDWAKAIGGPAVDICDQGAVPQPVPTSTTPTPCPAAAIKTVGRFWSDAYDAAWRALQSQLALKYDNDPFVTEVSLSSCSSLTSEPFVQPEDNYSHANMQASGYTDAGYQMCLAGAVARDYAPYWHATPVDFSFNPFQLIDPVPKQSDLAFTENTIDACRAQLGSRCILLNETMGKFTPAPSPAPGATPAGAAEYFAMWEHMHDAGGTIAFETASPPNLLIAWGSNLTGWSAAVTMAIRYGASSLELFPPQRSGVPCTTPPTRLWVEGYTCFSDSTMAGWKGQLTPAN